MAAYLEAVAHEEVIRLDLPAVHATAQAGERQPGVPSAEPFWVASTEGAGAQTLDWTAESGQWAVVVMNADASPGIAAEATTPAPARHRSATVGTTAHRGDARGATA